MSHHHNILNTKTSNTCKSFARLLFSAACWNLNIYEKCQTWICPYWSIISLYYNSTHIYKSRRYHIASVMFDHHKFAVIFNSIWLKNVKRQYWVWSLLMIWSFLWRMTPTIHWNYIGYQISLTKSGFVNRRVYSATWSIMIQVLN